MKNSTIQSTLAALSLGAFMTACGGVEQSGAADQAGLESLDPSSAEVNFEKTDDPITACDDQHYDHWSYLAALGVAAAQELGRWQPTVDFVSNPYNGVSLSGTGLARCKNGCENIKSILSLQNNGGGLIQRHDPALFKSKLISYFDSQMIYSQSHGVLEHELSLQSVTSAACGYRYWFHAAKKVHTVRTTVIAAHSGKCMEVGGYSKDDGALIQQYRCHNDDNQGFALENISGAYRLRSETSGKCVRPVGTGASNVEQRTCDTSSSQLFDIIAINGKYQLKNRAAGLCLGVQSASTADAAPMRVNTCSSAADQQFSLIVQEADYKEYKAATNLVAANSGKCVDVANNSMNDGATIWQYTCGVSDNQAFILENVAGAYRLKGQGSGKCLGAVGSTATSKIEQRTCDTSSGNLFQVIPTNGKYQLKNLLGGMCVEVQDSSTANTAGIRVNNCNASAANQQFGMNVTQTDLKEYKTPAPLVAAHSGKCLDVAWASTNDGASLVQYQCNGGTNQGFVLESIADAYRLKAVHSSKCLRAVDTAATSKLEQRECDNTNSQLFDIIPTNGKYQLRNRAASMCVEVQDASTGDFANIRINECNAGAANQQFSTNLTLTDVKRYISPTTVMAAHSGKCMDVAGMSVDDGALMTQYTCHGASNQSFNLESVAGAYRLKALNSGKCLRALGTTATSKIEQRTCDTSSSQLFDILRINDEYQLVNRSAGMCLEVQDASTTDGAYIRVSPCNASAPNQRFWMNLAQIDGDMPGPRMLANYLQWVGGKDNAYIAFETTGNQVSIDPMGTMVEGGSTAQSGNCIVGSSLYDPTRTNGGKCCEVDGKYGNFAQTTWNKSLYYCR